MLENLENALRGTGLAFAHFGWSKAPAGDYGVYAEDGSNDLEAGDEHAEKALTGTVDYFTRDASGACKDVIEAALESSGCWWALESIQYEDDTGLIHWEWSWEVA